MSPDNRDSPRRKLFGARGRGSAGQTTSVFYASDFHGSDQCWKKFLSAAKFYGTQVLIMGGDLAGKAMVPITAEGDKTYRATFMGELRTAKSDSELEELIHEKGIKHVHHHVQRHVSLGSSSERSGSLHPR